DGGREDRLHDEMEVPPLGEVRDVPQGAGRDVVECEHLPAVVQEKLRKMGADEPRSAGDQRLSAHGGEGYRPSWANLGGGIHEWTRRLRSESTFDSEWANPSAPAHVG